MIIRFKKTTKISLILSQVQIGLFKFRNGDIDSEELRTIVSEQFRKILEELEMRG